MEQFFFIVNPVSGSGRAVAEYETVRALLEEKGVFFKTVYTERPGHAAQLAAEAADEGYARIVAVGGDGTVNEVASALVNRESVLCVLPFGTGNDLTRVVGFPADPEKAVETLLSGRVVKMDAGEANGEFFVNVAGLGFDVDVLVKTLKYKEKYPRGMTPYFLGILDALRHLRTIHMTVAHDGETLETEGIILSVGNGQFIGGGMRAVPMADPFDGYLDCVYVERISVLKFLALLPGFLKGKHIGNPAVHHFRTKELRVSTREECVLNYDGDLKNAAPAVFRILPGALNVLVPAEEST
jgi:YegS/Rv2252/BmrU family lipid kinase